MAATATLTTITKQGAFDSDVAGQINTNFTNINGVLGAGSFTGKVTLTQPATGSTLTIIDGKTLTVNKTLTLDGTDSTTQTFPTTNATIARTDAGQTFTGANTLSGTVLGGLTAATGINYIASETGANNAIVGTFTGAPALTAGLVVLVKLGHTLQAGANTFAYAGGGALGIKSAKNVANDIGTAYASTGVIQLMYDGTRWVDLSQ